MNAETVPLTYYFCKKWKLKWTQKQQTVLQHVWNIGRDVRQHCFTTKTTC